MTITTHQCKVLAYLRVFFAANHCLPPQSVIARDFGWKSPNAANEVLQRLELAGALQRNELGGLKFTVAGLHGPLESTKGALA